MTHNATRAICLAAVLGLAALAQPGSAGAVEAPSIDGESVSAASVGKQVDVVHRCYCTDALAGGQVLSAGAGHFLRDRFFARCGS